MFSTILSGLRRSSSVVVLLALVASAVLSTVQLSAQSGPLFELIPPERSGITYRNRIVETEKYNITLYINALNGDGVGAADLNNDGLVDLLITGTQAPTKLYLNRGNFRFEDVTAQSGIRDSGTVTRGVQMVDINNDGWMDIYVCCTFHPNRFYINNGDGTFTDRAKEYGLDISEYSVQTAFFDYDRDGDLDMYLVLSGAQSTGNYVHRGIQDRLYRNNNNGTFTEVTDKAGLYDSGYGLNVNIADVNNDGWPDIFVSNDFEVRDLLYINNRNGTFTNQMTQSFAHTSTTSMGSDAADFNNDGLIDIFVDDMLPEQRVEDLTHMPLTSVFARSYDTFQLTRNTLQLNRGGATFSDIAPLSGVEATDWSWGAFFADLDNDGWKDLYVVAGIWRDFTALDVVRDMRKLGTYLAMSQSMPHTTRRNYAYRNRGDLTFADSSNAWGLGAWSFSNSPVYADLDNDGDLDLVVHTVDTNVFVYRNQAVEQGRGNYLRIRCAGASPNINGIGTRVELRSGGKYQMAELQTARGYLGSVEPVLHFGLGSADRIDTVTVTWPDGARQTLRDVRANQVLVVRRTEASNAPAAASPGGATPVKGGGKKGKKEPTPAKPQTLFTQSDSAAGPVYNHVENLFDDTRRERLLPVRQANLAGGVAVGDVNGDGLEDVFFCASHLLLARLYFQTPAGTFVESPDTVVFNQDSICEDMGAIFFDADEDGDLDLYVVSGGNEQDTLLGRYEDRLYINDGHGGFSKSADLLPAEKASGSSVVAADYDNDGDLDLFVGGRAVPGRYPYVSRSMLLRNDGGRFTDVTDQLAPQLAHSLIINSAIWSDADNDGWMDLVIAPQWGSPTIVRNNEGKSFTTLDVPALREHTGWWNSVVAGDFDNDGDLDYVFGNYGTNWRREASPRYPLRLYARDFDNNTSLDLFFTYSDSSGEYPVRDWASLTSQMPFFNRLFPTWRAFAMARAEQMIPRSSLDSAYRLDANDLRTSYVENLGNGQFAVRALPTIAQISPTFGMTVDDYDNDGNLDLMLVGNFFATEPMTTRYDAGTGLLLKGDGHGGLTPLPVSESGFLCTGDARGMATVKIGKDGRSIANLVVINNGASRSFRRDLGSTGAKLWTLPRGEHATHAIITFNDGRTRRHEFQCGSGYLSQSTPSLVVTPAMKSVALWSGTRPLREVKLIAGRSR